MHINILFVTQTLGAGGSERVVLDLCKGLNKQIFSVYVAGLYGGILIDEFRKNGIDAFSLNKGDGIDFSSIRQIRNLIFDKKINIINAHHFSPFVHTFLASALTKAKIIYTDHTVKEIENLPLSWQLLGTLFLKYSNAVIGISHDVTKKLTQKFKIRSNKAFTIQNAVDVDRFKAHVNIAKKRTELGIGDDDKIIGIVGNLREQKNHNNIIRALPLVQKKIPNIKLVIVGEGVIENDLRNEVEKLGIINHVIFLGTRLDIHEIYHTFDIYCLCSHYEGLPLTVLEAMCCKLPVVGTNVYGIKDIIKHNYNGLLVPTNNHESLAEAIIDLLNNPSLVKRLTTSAYNYVLRNHDKIIWLKQYEELFKSIQVGNKHFASYSHSDQTI